MSSAESSGPVAAGPPSGSSPSYRRTLRNGRFFRLWIAQLVSQSGDFIFEVALLWLVLEITGSVFAVAIVVVGTILPGVVLGPLLGVYIDRWDRRRTLIATNLVQGVVVVVLSGLVVSGEVNLVGLFLIVLLLGSGATTVRVATGAYVPSVVPPSDLPPANGLLSLSGSMNQIIGLSIGGLVVALLGVRLPIEYDAVTFFVAALVLLSMRRTDAPPASAPPTPASRFWGELAEGLRFIRENRFMIEIIALGIVVNMFGFGVTALFAPFAAFVLHGGPAGYGFLGAAVAAGSILGATVTGRVDLRRSAGRYLFGGGLGIGALILLLGLTESLTVALVLMFGLGVAVAVTNLPISVVVQAKVPRHLLGRVGGALGALIAGTGPAGPLVAGWLAQRWSVSTVFVSFGIVIVVIMGVAAITMTSLRTVEY